MGRSSPTARTGHLVVYVNDLLLAASSWKFMDSIKAKLSVMDASSIQMYSFLPAFWAGDTHEETNVLPIGDQEEKGK